ncbi:Putative helicase, P-loop containing nucleoside triphosphate hydrolase [Septoria linicola]|uniref:ATP-dependent RNA helicase n=1 Tax=Septoria linicola TaxID=215465 RepID=A0A9Q9AZB0_9PEZI|nr:putative helicase, P-loop containing nucleoside triphosphate hydrolase [Septoria linicola]USW53411.1 Putative helicase, P-loop containing nucleoside triphosphate hydrolase [Septoria linicola]
MDPLKLLSRSTKRSKAVPTQRSTPSSGHNAQPQLFPAQNEAGTNISKKRKRVQDTGEASAELDFFGGSKSKSPRTANNEISIQEDTGLETNAREKEPSKSTASALSDEQCKSILRQHKLKVTWLNPVGGKISRSKDKGKKKSKLDKAEKLSLYPQPLQSFSELRQKYGISARVASNVEEQGYVTPTEVQLGAIPLLLEPPSTLLSAVDALSSAASYANIDLLTVAPTGSGKTLAFALPLMHHLLQSRREAKDAPRTISAIILAPTKELAGQIVNECRKLARNTGLRVTQVRKGMKLGLPGTPDHASDDEDEQQTELPGSTATVVKADILVSTPGVLATIVKNTSLDNSSALSNVRHLILDEADVLLDPLFREQTLAIWNSIPGTDLRTSLWSATMGSNIEELARAVMRERSDRLTKAQDSDVIAAPLVRLVVGLKDSAVPNIEHKLVYSASEQGKLMGLRNLLHPATTSADSGPPLLPPFLVFTQTIERAIALHSELLYDIPAEAGGISRIAVLHSDLSDAARDAVMTKFRKGEVWVLITTDLLSRGVDFRGVNGVVNYDIPTSSAAYIHRVGRTGRAGREGGVAVTLFSQEDIPYMKPIANVVAAAQKQQGLSEEGVQKWLLDALPNLNKKAKQDLKKHGVEARTARGMNKDPKAARKAKISTKAGYVRREENKRKGAILGSRRRQGAAGNASDDDVDFGGFD